MQAFYQAEDEKAQQNMCKNYDDLKLKTNKSRSSSFDDPLGKFYA